LEDDTSGTLNPTEVPAGKTILEEGQKTGKICVLRKGALDIVAKGVRVGRLHQRGALVGEISALLDQPHSASVVTAEPSEIVLLDQVRGYFKSHPAASLQMARLLAKRLNVTNEYFVNLREHFDELNKLLNESAIKNPAKKGETSILAKKATETYTNAAQHINMAVFGGMLHPLG
jgi:CRP-like cAMP-binding protein